MTVLDAVHLAPHAVRRWAAECPQNTAIQEVDGRHLSYSELDEQALTWAGAFTRLGIAAGEHVATMLPAGIEAPVTLLALSWAGAIEVPINTAHRGPLLTHVLRQSDATTVIIDGTLLDRLLEVVDELPDVERIIVTGDPPKVASSASPRK